MKKTVITCLLFVLIYSVNAQKENNIWYFGHNAGVDFNSGAPVPLYDGQLETYEGCASICDENGNLLFYSNGVTVWNKNHEIMDGGYNLDGNVLATNSATILKCPGEENLYYIFTIGDRVINSMGYYDKCKYSIVDMEQDNGLGAVLEKNIFLVDNCTEKLAIVRHQNPDEYWVVGHYSNTNEFWALWVGPGGIYSTPVITSVGAVHSGRLGGNCGVIKVSHQGDKIAVAVRHERFIEILKFDNATGEPYEPVHLDYLWTNEVYAVEFSPDDSKFYATTFHNNEYAEFYNIVNAIYQYDVTAHDKIEITNSEELIVEYHERITKYGDELEEYRLSLGMMQCAPDDKIYIARYEYDFLASIEAPNEKGNQCQFIDMSVPVGDGGSTFGLPADVRGKSNPESQEVHIWTPDTLAEIGDHHFKLPVYAKYSGDYLTGDTLTLTATIDIDAFFFEPTGISSGTFTDISFNNRRLEMEIEVPDFVIESEQQLITEITGIVLFADTNHTDIYINEAAWDNPLIETVAFDGSMRLYGDCIPKNRKIQFTEEPEFTVSPNPAIESINIKYTCLQGQYQLMLVSDLGETVYSKKWNSIFSQGFNELNINTDDLVSGQYILILRSPLGVINRRLSIVK